MNKKIARVRRGLKTKAIQKRNPSLARFVIHRTLSHIYCQIVVRGEHGDKVVASSSTLDKELRSTLCGSKLEQAKQVGALLANRATSNDISKVAFDRNGYKYHGRVKALAEAARDAGLIF